MRDRARRVAALVAVALVAVVALAGCGSDEEAPFSGTVLTSPYQVPDVDFTDTDGEPFSLAADTDDRLTLVFFGYTRCVDICPAVLSHLASALTRLDEADREQVQVVMVTSDPDHDDAATIRGYLDGFDTTFVGLRADFDTTAEVGLDLAVGLDRTDPGGHTTQILGVDPADEVPVFWGSDTSPKQFADDIHTLLDR
ncbi:MAG: electron transport protein SCO1/SenC [Nocardioides sp.]|nr:electron transport protein SCO1/SenC [Nocardioides sp.]